MKTTEIIDAIWDIDSIEDIRLIISAASDHRKVLSNRKAVSNALSFKTGDIVCILSGLRPKYLVGKEGEVVSVTGSIVEIKLGLDARRYAGIQVRIGADLLEKVG